jgi:hypothetical protein
LSTILRAETPLRRYILHIIVPLKMLHAHANSLCCHMVEHGSYAGVLLLVPSATSAWDAVHYPMTELVAFLAADDRAKPKLRRQRLGRRVVESALAELADDGLWPRYQMQKTTTPGASWPKPWACDCS